MLGLGLGLTNTYTLGTGVPQYLMIDGVRCILLFGADGQALKGADGQYLYGVL